MIKAFIKQVSMIILLSSIFFFVQNDMDDWEEHEELRAIEGLEGKFFPV